ncbi:MAG TPA: FtsX-like permease family protein [Acidiferrobacterales bacterium]|nr:FtsX-like permease family protein [Acidiferrobacterales bacterium]
MTAAMLRYSLRALRRNWRAGELKVLAAALVIAVASITSVGFFTDRVRLAMSQQAAELLAADLVVAAAQAPPAGWEQHAQAQRLRTARTASFPSVVLAGDNAQLVDVKAVSAGYPLRGALRVADAPFGAERVADGIPAPGTVWVDERLLGVLDLRVGGSIKLGALRFGIAQVITFEPDRGGNLFSYAPRLLMNAADLGRTQLLVPGSRVSHGLLLAGPPEALAGVRTWIEARLSEGQRVLDVRDARPELKTALERAEKFLGLAALVSVVLAGVAVATAARRYSARHLDGAAVMRCLGATQGFISRLHFLEMFWLGVGASLVGCIIGFAAQEVLAQLQAGLFATQLPAPSLQPVLVGVLTGLILLLGFALPAILRLKSVPPARVLRRDLGPLPASALSVYGAALAAVTALLFWQAADVNLTATVLAGAVATLLVLVLAAFALVRALNLLRGQVGVAWRYGLANIARRAQGSVTQILAFGLGIMVLLLLSLVRSDLLAAWQAKLPVDAPNQFVINVQPGQVQPIQAFFAARGLQEARLHPMVRGRLTALNEHPLSGADYPDDRARRLVEREFNLSWSAQPPEGNRIVAGNWWAEGARGLQEVSVEKGLAETLGLRLGDKLTWRIADREMTVTITSLRSVEWDSFRANFFVIAPPGLLESFPATFITSFHLPAENRAWLAQLVRAFPNVTLIDVDALMTKVRSIMDRVNLSVQYVFLFTLFAGLTVLYSAIQSTQDERLYESALLRTLGASRAHILKGLAAEFVAIGLLAGLLAAFAANLAGLVLARQVFQLDYTFDPWLWIAGPAAGALGVGLFGILGARFVLNRPPLQSLREL